LILDGDQFTDTGLENLKGLANLQGMFLEGNQLTLEGIEKLQEALPDCEIVYCGGVAWSVTGLPPGQMARVSGV